MRKRVLTRKSKVRFHWRKHEQTRFCSIASCILKRYQENKIAETCVSYKGNLRKHTKTWCGSVVTAATETGINGVYPPPETHVSRYVSATFSRVSATLQSADSWHFVLWACKSLWYWEERHRHERYRTWRGTRLYPKIKLIPPTWFLRGKQNNTVPLKLFFAAIQLIDIWNWRYLTNMLVTSAVLSISSISSFTGAIVASLDVSTGSINIAAVRVCSAFVDI